MMTAVVIVLGVLVVGLATALVATARRLERTRGDSDAGRRREDGLRLEGERVRQHAERMSLAMAELPLGVAAFGASGEVLFANPVADRYVDARHGEAVVELRIRELVGAAMRSGDPITEEVEVHLGALTHLGIDVVPLADDGDIAALVVVEDRSGAHRLDAIRRDFVANISHELKTPLGAMSVLAETLRGEHDAVVRDRLSARISAEALRMGRLVDDILDLSDVESASLEPAPVPLDEVVTAVVARARSQADEAGVTLTLAVPEHSVEVMGDLRQLDSAVTNLVDNAIKYTAARGRSPATVAVSLEHRSDEVRVVIADQGIGIAREHLDRIFERFYRVDRGRSRKTGGTGLGLAIVKHVARNHGGDVTVRSTLGSGSTFVMRLPTGGES